MAERKCVMTPPVTVKTEFTDVAILKGMRAALGMSQENFAELVGMKRQQLSGYENKHHAAPVQKLTAMAAKAGLRVTVVIDRADGSPTP